MSFYTVASRILNQKVLYALCAHNLYTMTATMTASKICHKNTEIWFHN